MSRGRLLGWIAILAAAVGLLIVAGAAGGGVESDAERVQRLSESFACPTCAGQSVAESNAAVAATIRGFISDQVTAGASDGEIRDELVRSYDSEVLLNPPAEGIATLVWILPVVLVVLGAVGLAGAVTRNQRAGRDPSAEDVALVDRARRSRATEPEAAGP